MQLKRNYKTYLTEILSNSSIGELAIYLNDTPTSDQGYLLLEPGTVKEENIFYHRRVGNTVFAYAINRSAPVEHLVNAQVLFSNSIDYLNYALNQINDQGFIYKKDAQNIIVTGGVFYIDGVNVTIADLDTSLNITGKSLIAGVLNYIYITSGDYTIVSTPIASEAYLVATVDVSVGGIVTAIDNKNTFVVGNKGETGEQGIQGIKGDKGDQGIQGPQGPQGIQGLKGDAGAKGDKGDTGATGATGSVGAQGPQGIQGLTGNGIASNVLYSTVGNLKTYRITYTNGTTFDYVVRDGEAIIDPLPPYSISNSSTRRTVNANIASLDDIINVLSTLVLDINEGLVGPQGPQGIQGLTGAAGSTGATGSQGIQGLKGDKGDKGDTGATGPQGPQGIQGPAGSGSGDMLKTTYDPTNINSSPFNRSNHAGTQLANTISDFSTAVLLTAYSKATVDSNIATAIGTRAALTGATFSGAISATNLSGTNSGDETTATIKTKLGAAGSLVDGYLTGSDWNLFVSKVSSVTGSMVDNTNPDNPVIGSDSTKQDVIFSGTVLTLTNGGTGELLLDVVDVTASKTLLFPNKSGTLATLSDITGLSWGASISGTTGSGILSTLSASSATGANAIKISINTTQTNIVNGLNIDAGFGVANVFHKLINLNYIPVGGTGMYIESVYSTNGGVGSAYGIYMNNVNSNTGIAHGVYLNSIASNTAGTGYGFSIAACGRTGMFSNFKGADSVRTNDVAYEEYSNINATNSTISATYVLHHFKRIQDQQAAAGTYTQAGSVIHIENDVIQTGAGVTVNTVACLKLTQDNLSTGGHILFNSYSGVPTTDGTLYFDGTNFKARIGGVTKTFTIT